MESQAFVYIKKYFSLLGDNNESSDEQKIIDLCYLKYFSIAGSSLVKIVLVIFDKLPKYGNTRFLE